MTVMPNIMEGDNADQAKRSMASSQSVSRNHELLLLLRESLSETVEISALQQRLLSSLTRGVAMDGLHYHHETLDLDIRVGKQSTHSCGYRLLFTDEYLGEITFKRNRKFSEREMQLIESLIPALLNPLRESLKSQHFGDV
ncbi:MAG: hypothetical protein Q7L07_11125 [Pseudohongiella sp.]|jgi:hypothetical protein|nr:hypothetical protein [Pseudohongiella sp.]